MIALLGPDAPVWLLLLFEWFDNLGRYLLVAGPAFVVFWIWGRERFRRRLIQKRYPSTHHLWREFRYSMSTAVIFALTGAGVFYGGHAGVFRLYLDVPRYGVSYLLLSALVLIVLQDAYFYWTHRAMHHRWLYSYMHKVHHLSTNPSPWAAYAFAPAEALVHAAFVPLVLLAMPVHPLALAAFLLHMIVRNVWGHLGMEFYPRWFVRHAFGRWHTTTTHHNLHHRRFHSNYGLYFTCWDRFMGTTHPDYERTFDEVAL